MLFLKGQCDSPGINAKNLCYFLIEVESSYILDIEVVDKRHVGLVFENIRKSSATFFEQTIYSKK